MRHCINLGKQDERKSMIKKLYRWLYRVTSRPDERGECPGGRWQGAVRENTLGLCRGIRGKALEIGCGAGLFAIKLAAQEPVLEVWGVDNNEAMVKKAEARAAEKGLNNIHLAVQDAAMLSFDEGFFDAVICINLFVNMNIDSAALFLKYMMRVCRPSGRLIFEFRNSRNIFFVLKYKLARYYDDSAPYPLYAYDPERVEKVVKGLGLSIVSKKFVGSVFKYFAPIIIIEARKA